TQEITLPKRSPNELPPLPWSHLRATMARAVAARMTRKYSTVACPRSPSSRVVNQCHIAHMAMLLSSLPVSDRLRGEVGPSVPQRAQEGGDDVDQHRAVDHQHEPGEDEEGHRHHQPHGEPAGPGDRFGVSATPL